MTEQAAQDPNMPPMEEVETEVETEAKVEGQADTAPAPVEKEGSFVETDNEKVQARINKITAEKYAEKRRADDAERKLSEQQAPQIQTQSADEPKLEDFDYDEAAHTSALIDYRVDKKAIELQQTQQHNVDLENDRVMTQSFNEKVAAFDKEDYQATVANIPPLPPETLEAVMQSDKGPELAYYLGKHLDVADEIAQSSPISAAMRLGQLSAQLSANVTETKTSAAPAPIEPVESGGSLSKDIEEMSVEEIFNL